MRLDKQVAESRLTDGVQELESVGRSLAYVHNVVFEVREDIAALSAVLDSEELDVEGVTTPDEIADYRAATDAHRATARAQLAKAHASRLRYVRALIDAAEKLEAALLARDPEPSDVIAEQPVGIGPERGPVSLGLLEQHPVTGRYVGLY